MNRKAMNRGVKANKVAKANKVLQAEEGVRCWKSGNKATRFEACIGESAGISNAWEHYADHVFPIVRPVLSPTVFCPVPAHVTYKQDTIEQCCAPLRAGGNPATVHCNDGVILYSADTHESLNVISEKPHVTGLSRLHFGWNKEGLQGGTTCLPFPRVFYTS